jgi:hypothetical protein
MMGQRNSEPMPFDEAAEFNVPFGKYRNMTLQEVHQQDGPEGLRYLLWMQGLENLYDDTAAALESFLGADELAEDVAEARRLDEEQKKNRGGYKGGGKWGGGGGGGGNRPQQRYNNGGNGGNRRPSGGGSRNNGGDYDRPAKPGGKAPWQ